LCAGPRDDLDGESFRTFVGVKIAVELAAPPQHAAPARFARIQALPRRKSSSPPSP